MSWHLHGTVLTAQGTAANNRGDTEGLKSTLQKIYRNGEPYTTVSAEAIRYALREHLQNHEERDPNGERLSQLQAELDRTSKRFKEAQASPADNDKQAQKRIQNLEQQKGKLEQEVAIAKQEVRPDVAIRLNRWMPDHRSNKWHDEHFTQWKDFIDDDVLGFMHATEGTSHRGILEICRAISTTPWRGEVIVNYATPRSNPAISSDDPIPYAIEVHHTRYQYSFSMTPEHLARDAYRRTKWMLEALLNIRRVGGNHAHFLFDFSPEAIVLRWTHDPAPRIVYCFDEGEYGELSLRRLKARVDKGEIKSREKTDGKQVGLLWIGSVTELSDCPKLGDSCGPKKLGPAKAIEKVLTRIKETLNGG